MAKVCNPIYDTVFNAIINSPRHREVLLDGILNKKIVDVEIKSYEKVERKGGPLKLHNIEFSFTLEKTKHFQDSFTIEFSENVLSSQGYAYLPSDMIFRRMLYAALDEKLREKISLEDECIIQAKANDQLEYELNKVKEQLAETKNQLAASIKMLSSFGATPEQIAAQLNISIEEVCKVL